MTTAIAAIIFVPPAHPSDGQFVTACLEHIDRRGYRLYTVLRDWDEVAKHLAAGTAEVVILATREHRAGEADRVEVVDEERTRILRRRNAAVGRHEVPDSLTPNTLKFGSDGAALGAEVAAYRTGYADGYVDCTTMRAMVVRPPWQG